MNDDRNGKDLPEPPTYGDLRCECSLCKADRDLAARGKVDGLIVGGDFAEASGARAVASAAEAAYYAACQERSRDFDMVRTADSDDERREARRKYVAAMEQMVFLYDPNIGRIRQTKLARLRAFAARNERALYVVAGLVLFAVGLALAGVR